MIAKASTIPHGANAIRYSVNKDRADIVKANLLPDDISPEAMYGRMMLVQKMFAEKINKGRPLGRNVIRIEISPSEKSLSILISTLSIMFAPKNFKELSAIKIVRTVWTYNPWDDSGYPRYDLPDTFCG